MLMVLGQTGRHCQLREDFLNTIKQTRVCFCVGWLETWALDDCTTIKQQLEIGVGPTKPLANSPSRNNTTQNNKAKPVLVCVTGAWMTTIKQEQEQRSSGGSWEVDVTAQQDTPSFTTTATRHRWTTAPCCRKSWRRCSGCSVRYCTES